jgi:hypothetical protein
MIDEKPNKLCGKWALVELGVCIEGEVAGIHFLEFDGSREQLTDDFVVFEGDVLAGFKNKGVFIGVPGLECMGALEGVAGNGESVNGSRKNEWGVKHLKMVVFDADIAVVALAGDIFVNDGVDADDGIAKLEHIGEAILKSIVTDDGGTKLPDSTGFKPSIGVTCHENGASGGADEVVFHQAFAGGVKEHATGAVVFYRIVREDNLWGVGDVFDSVPGL